MSSTHRSLCRFCHAHCAVKVRVDDGRVAHVIGDKDDPVYAGFSCAKGREVPRQMAHAELLLHSQRRRADGTHERIASAGREIADSVLRLDRDSPRAIAMYSAHSCVRRHSRWLGVRGRARPPMLTSAIDQHGKAIALALPSGWASGRRPSARQTPGSC
jgi:anaerobic selenocysteine-containing dehydrogenase